MNPITRAFGKNDGIKPRVCCLIDSQHGPPTRAPKQKGQQLTLSRRYIVTSASRYSRAVCDDVQGRCSEVVKDAMLCISLVSVEMWCVCFND